MEEPPCDLYLKSKRELPDDEIHMIVSKLLRADPDPNGVNCEWIIDSYLRNEFIIDEDEERVKDDIMKYKKLFGETESLPKKGYLELKSKIDKRLENLNVNKFKTTPTLAFIYQIFQKDNYQYLPSTFSNIVKNIENFITFDYQDAINCALDLNYPKWEVVKKFLDLLKIYETDTIDIDTEFLFKVFQMEVKEFQKGNITVLHAKNPGFMVLDIISQLISGSYEGYKPKCERNDYNSKQKALSIYETLNFDKGMNDSTPEIRAREIAGNISILNNAFVYGESTLEFLFKTGSIGIPSYLIKDLKLSNQTNVEMIRLINKLNKLGNNLLVLYSFPISKLDIYVYPSIAFGYKIEDTENIYNFLEEFTNEKLWLDKLYDRYYLSQVRIIDLCFTKYAFDDGVRIYQMIDIPEKQLNGYMNEVEKIVLSDKNLTEIINKQIDIPKTKRKNPLKSITGYQSSIKSKPKTDIMKYMKDLLNLEPGGSATHFQDKRITYLEKKIIKNPELAYVYARDVINKRWLEAEKGIAKYPNLIYEYAKNVIKNRWPQDEEIGKEAESNIINDKFSSYNYARFVIKDRFPEAESVLIKDPQYAYLYAKDVLKGRWPQDEEIGQQAEEIIMKNPKFAYEYAKNIIKSRWPQAEPYILKNQDLIYDYAKDVLKDRWPQDEEIGKVAEEIILQNPILINLYFENLVKGRWKEAESTIFSKNPYLAYQYAVNSLYGRWPQNEIVGKQAEQTIINFPEASYLYAKDILKGRWPKEKRNEAEDIILTSPEIAYKYAMDVIKKRWDKAEKVIINQKDPKLILDYYNDVLKKRWPKETREEAENILLNNKYYANSDYVKKYIKNSDYRSVSPSPPRSRSGSSGSK
jgi:hypothetical protein